MRILLNEERNEALFSAYEVLVNDRKTTTAMVTGAERRGEPTSIYAHKTIYHNSFLLRSVRDLGIETKNPESHTATRCD